MVDRVARANEAAKLLLEMALLPTAPMPAMLEDDADGRPADCADE